jgi:ABC-type transport system substrate-binding protein
MERKNLAILSLLILVNASIIGNMIIALKIYSNLPSETKNILRIAYSESDHPAVLDPVDSLDDVSNDMIRHICDTLWRYDLTDPTFPLEMLLATSFSWNIDMNELIVSLREEVWFHDGSYFNSTAVKFTFDRILYFINWSGELRKRNTHTCNPAEFFFDMHRVSIINRTEIIDEYTVKFILNKPNIIFLSLLTYEACSILHPNSAKATEYLHLGEDILVGTGPFKNIHYIAGEELQFDGWKLYWGENIFWDRMLWEYYSDTTTANEAFLGGKADYLYNPLSSFIPAFQADVGIHLEDFSAVTPFMYWELKELDYRIINDSRIRKTIAYAYNYSYFIEEIRQGHAIKAEQLLPPGFPYHNTTFKGPYYNTTIARQAMMDVFPNITAAAGCTSEPFGANPANDAAWSALDLLVLEVYVYEGWSAGLYINEELAFYMNEELVNDMNKVGIIIEPDYWDWLIWPPPDMYARAEILYNWVTFDYLEPFNVLKSILHNKSNRVNYHFLNYDNIIQEWLKQYERTDPANTTRRAKLLYKIQQRAINELYLLVPLGFEKTYYVHHRSLGGVGYNIMGKLWLADSYYIPGIHTI